MWLNSSSPSNSVEELVGQMDSVPRVPFCVRLTGQDRIGNKLERASTEMIQPTHVEIQVSEDKDLPVFHLKMYFSSTSSQCLVTFCEILGIFLLYCSSSRALIYKILNKHEICRLSDSNDNMIQYNVSTEYIK